MMTLTLDRVGWGTPDTGLLAGMISTGGFLKRHLSRANKALYNILISYYIQICIVYATLIWDYKLLLRAMYNILLLAL